MKKIESLIFASSNQGKIKEINTIINESTLIPLEIKAPENKIEVDETGDTFTQNAFLKAKAYYDLYKVPILSDDSGLIINARPELLGVKSARFHPKEPDYAKKCEFLIKELESIKNREAYFTSILCLYISPEEKYFFEGRLNGKIDFQLTGDQGFGYDPIFLPLDHPSGLSLASDAVWKNEHSHRRKALKLLVDFLHNRS